MPRHSRLGAPPLDSRAAGTRISDELAAEAIESVEGMKIALPSRPARGILNALMIGAGIWTLIFAVVALTRAVFST
jgi:hypothetical protein